MPSPKKGPRFGRDPAHQRLIMANLAAHLFEAGHIVTTLPRAKALRPYAEHLITKAKHGGVHQRRQVIATDPRPERHAQALRRDRAALRRPQRRLPAHPEAGPAPRRQRAHGAHRTGVSQLSLAHGSRDTRPPSSLSSHRRAVAVERVHAEARRRVRRHRLPRVRRAARRSARSRASSPSVLARVLRTRVAAHVRGAHRRGSARVGSGGELRGRRADDRSGRRAARGERPARARGRRAQRRARRRRRSTPGARREWRAYRYTIVNRDAPDPFRARYAWWVPEALDLARACGWPPIRSSASTTSRASAARAPRDRRRCAGCSRRSGTTKATACSSTRSAPRAFCWQMVRSIVGTLVDVGMGKIRPGDILAILRGARPRRPPVVWRRRSGLCLWEVGYDAG